MIGLSQDGTLTLNLYARFTGIFRGCASINAPVGILDGALAGPIADPASPRRIPAIGSDTKLEGAKELASSEVSMHAIHSREDHVIPPANGGLIVERAGSDDIRLRWLANSYHLATLDNDFDLIVRSIGTFIVDIDSHRD